MLVETRFALGLLAAALAGCSGGADAATRRVTPAEINKVLTTARGGDLIVLAPGDYAAVRLSGRKFEPALEIDASAATLRGVTFNQVSGVNIRGGTFRLPPPVARRDTGALVHGAALRMDRIERVTVRNARFVGPGAVTPEEGDAFGEGFGVFVLGGSSVEVAETQMQGLKGGVVLTRVQDFTVRRNTFVAMRSDGVQIAESRKGLIEGNECSGTRIRDKEHPDCIQMWSRPTSPPTADIVIRGNRIRGETQGIGLFNHVRKGVDDGGFDRITIEDNDIEVSFPHGIGMFATRDSVVRNNRVRTFGSGRYRATININPPEVTRCGNTVAAAAGKAGIKDSPCK